MKKLQAGIIGCGNFAASQDFPNFSRHPDVEIKWACDAAFDNAGALARKYGVAKVTDNYLDVVNDPEVDFIKISTSPEIHLPIIEAAAAKGVHVFCEKPMAISEVEAWKIVKAVKMGKIKFCVDHNRTRSPAMISLKKRWLEHKANPRHQPWRFKAWDRPVCRDENNTQFLARMQDESASYSMAHANPLISPNKFYREITHWMDLACWLYEPQSPVKILAWGSARFSCGVYIEFSGGDIANIIFDCGGTFDFPKEMYEIAHNGILFRSLYFVENEYYGRPGMENEKFKLLEDCLPEVGKEEGFAGYMKKYRERVRNLSNARENYAALKVDKGWYNMLDAFVRSIREDTQPPSDEMAGLKSIYMAAMATKSLEFGHILQLQTDRLEPVFFFQARGG